MEVSIEIALKNLNKFYSLFKHNGKSLTKEQVRMILNDAKDKGYESTSQITEKDVEDAIAVTNSDAYNLLFGN